ADVKRQVWARDGGQCTFTSESGERCPARKRIEFDHAIEVARGGEATVDQIRLRCRRHNQYTAERTFGVEFMKLKRTAAQFAREIRARKNAAVTSAEAAAAGATEDGATKKVQEQEIERDLICGLRNLGYRADQARSAANHCTTVAEITLESRMRAALAYLRPQAVTHSYG